MASFVCVESNNQQGIGFDAYLDHLSKFTSEFSAEPEKSRRSFSWRATHSRMGGLTCWRLEGSHGYSMKVKHSTETLHISQPGIGSVAVSDKYRSTHVFPGSLVTHLVDDTREVSTKGAYAKTGLRFERPQLMQALSRFDERLSFHDLEPLMQHHLTDANTQSLCYSVQAVASALLDETHHNRSRAAMALLGESVLFLAIEKLVSNTAQKPPEFTRRHASRAAEYMHSNMHLPLTMSDVGLAAGASVRTLQSAFKAHYGTTPAAYLRRIRLEAARLELSSSDNNLPVQEVALKWGFTHMGRFAEAYRKAYGLLPSQLAGLRKLKI